LPPTPTPMLPPRYSEEMKDNSSNNGSMTTSSGHSSLSNGDVTSSITSKSPPVEWPDVGKLPGLYTSRHDATMIVLFLKCFDVETQQLLGVKPIYVNRQDKTGKLSSAVAEMMDWKETEGAVNIAFYEEIKPGMIEPLKPTATFKDCEIQDGDIICFMRVPSAKRHCPWFSKANDRLEDLVREGKYPDAVRYYEFLHNKVTLQFLPKSEQQPIKESFACVLSKNMKYEQVSPQCPKYAGY